VLGQLILFYFLTQTGQRRAILLESVVIAPEATSPGLLSFWGIDFGFFLSALLF